MRIDLKKRFVGSVFHSKYGVFDSIVVRKSLFAEHNHGHVSQWQKRVAERSRKTYWHGH